MITVVRKPLTSTKADTMQKDDFKEGQMYAWNPSDSPAMVVECTSVDITNVHFDGQRNVTMTIAEDAPEHSMGEKLTVSRPDDFYPCSTEVRISPTPMERGDRVIRQVSDGLEEGKVVSVFNSELQDNHYENGVWVMWSH